MGNGVVENKTERWKNSCPQESMNEIKKGKIQSTTDPEDHKSNMEQASLQPAQPQHSLLLLSIQITVIKPKFRESNDICIQCR